MPRCAVVLPRYAQLLGQAQRLCKVTSNCSAGAQAAARPGVDEDGGGLWEAQCTVLLWLATLVLLPFSMLSLDSSATGDEPQCALRAVRMPMVTLSGRACVFPASCTRAFIGTRFVVVSSAPRVLAGDSLSFCWFLS